MNDVLLFPQLRSESDDGMMSDQGSGFSLSVDQDDYHFRPSNVFIPATPGQSVLHATYMSIPDHMVGHFRNRNNSTIEVQRVDIIYS